MLFGNQGIQVSPIAPIMMGAGVLIAGSPTDRADHDEFFAEHHINIRSFRSRRQRLCKVRIASAPALRLGRWWLIYGATPALLITRPAEAILPAFPEPHR
jgi:hypothetical protein